MDPQTIKELNKDMKNWGKKNRQTAQVKISAEGIEKALIAGGKDFDRREFDRQVIVFMHIVDAVIYNDIKPKDYAKLPVERLFEVIDSRTYRGLMKQAEKNYASDEEPTDFFRDLYQRFLEWRENPDRKNNVSSHKNYGARSLNERWELEEYKREGWMSSPSEE